MISQDVQVVSSQAALSALVTRLACTPAFALDIETTNWWDRARERVSLIQFAFRESAGEADATRVVIVDAFAGIDLEPLRQPLELSEKPKAIHNASYDAVRLSRHFGFKTAPIFDTMLAARRSGEKKCSLQAQVERHLGMALDKTEQRSDWGRRPLDMRQLRYAALDASCTLLLYEKQVGRGLRGDYVLRQPGSEDTTRQELLPLEQAAAPVRTLSMPRAETASDLPETNSRARLALLGIITELSGRYSPEQLAASVGSERVGLAGWIVDQTLGPDADLDEGSARLEIAGLCEARLVGLSPTRRLESRPAGADMWKQNRG
ncbi:MAG: ribonuclease D [Blastocatellia bacterium]